jgi:transcriptional regulator GlxA family with amidase domain
MWIEYDLSMSEIKPIWVGILGFEGVMALDLVGPVDAFSSAFIEDGDGRPVRCYEVVVIGLTARPFTSENGIIFKAHTTIAKAPRLDTLIIPGGRGLREPNTQRRAASWISTQADRTRRIATVCTGTFGLAATGLLDGRKVTTHWRQADELSTTFPGLTVDGNALYLKDGKFYTCAGVTAGVDLSLALIEEDFGPRVALSVARELVVYLKRPGGQEQFSEPLQFQTNSRDRFADLAAWMQGHLRHDLSAEVLADRANLSPRHFARKFKQVFGTTPAVFVEDLRLREARDRLTMPDQTITTIAASVGFKSDDAFRRAFERRYGLQPSSYRKHFSLAGPK